MVDPPLLLSTEDGFRYISNIEMPGGIVRYVPLHPPRDGATKVTSAADWTVDMAELERAVTPKTRMIVSIAVPFPMCLRADFLI